MVVCAWAHLYMCMCVHISMHVYLCIYTWVRCVSVDSRVCLNMCALSVCVCVCVCVCVKDFWIESKLLNFRMTDSCPGPQWYGITGSLSLLCALSRLGHFPQAALGHWDSNLTRFVNFSFLVKCCWEWVGSSDWFSSLSRDTFYKTLTQKL